MRPLNISALSDPLPINVSHLPGDVAQSLLGEFLTKSGSPLDEARRRYEEITDEKSEPAMVPLHDGLMWHVIRPLREAKHCYVLGMPVACIAQAGLVGEMVALWRFRMLEPKVDGRPLDENLQKLLFKREFDKLGQDDRLNVLRALDTLDDTTLQRFKQLKNIRNRYLHFMVDQQSDIDHDACEAMQLACSLVVTTLNVMVVEGRWIIPQKVLRYIDEILHRRDDNASQGMEQ
jgi:hypothetical protein